LGWLQHALRENDISEHSAKAMNIKSLDVNQSHEDNGSGCAGDGWVIIFTLRDID